MTLHEREVMRMALAALEIYGAQAPDVGATISALRACLAQPEQYDQTELNLCKKCGWKAVWPDGCLVCEKQEAQYKKEWVGLTDKPTKIFGPNLEELLNSAGFYRKKEWVGLTDEEKMEILTRNITAPSRIDVAEALLKEKNNG
jgi:hypothetical protein